MSDLAEIMDDYDDMDMPEGLEINTLADAARADDPTRFTLDTPEHFDWAARKLARAKAETARLEAWKADELDKLSRAFDRRIKTHERDADFFHAMIEHAVRSMTPDAKGKRSVKTPHLTASVTRREHWEWPADDALMEWAKEAQKGAGTDLYRVKASPDKKAIKAYVQDTGDGPTGLEITEVESVRLEAND